MTQPLFSNSETSRARKVRSSYLENLPVEIQMDIAKYLPPASTWSFAIMNSYFQCLIKVVRPLKDDYFQLDPISEYLLRDCYRYLNRDHLFCSRCAFSKPPEYFIRQDDKSLATVFKRRMAAPRGDSDTWCTSCDEQAMLTKFTPKMSLSAEWKAARRLETEENRDIGTSAKHSDDSVSNNKHSDNDNSEDSSDDDYCDFSAEED
jgi:hypothetical protein